MLRRSDPSRVKNGERKVVHIAIGRLSPAIGGPYQSLSAYCRVLSESGVAVEVWYMPVKNEELSIPHASLQHNLGNSLQLVWRTLALLMRVRREPLVVFGVWHPVFLLTSLGMTLLRFAGRAPAFLVPTQSLSSWDWSKHKRTKATLAPLVFAALAQFEKVIFATRGELASSFPAWIRNNGVVAYHPIAPVHLAMRPESIANSIVFCGRVTEQKDPLLFIETLAMLPAHWVAHIVGTGPGHVLAGLRERSLELGVDARITWHGWKSRSDALGIIEQCSALVVTSHAENYCHVAVEAMAVGTPVVVVSRVAAAVDIGELRTGLIVKADPCSLGKAIQELDEDRELRATLVKAGTSFASDRQGDVDGVKLRRVILQEGADHV